MAVVRPDISSLGVADTLKALAVAAIYGLSFVAIQIGVNEMPPLLVTGYRFLFTALPLIFFIRRPAVTWSLLAAYGVTQGAIMFGLIFSAIDLGVPAGLASLVVQLQVFFTIGFSALLFAETPRWHQLIGACVAFVGIVVIAIAKSLAAPLLPLLMVVASAAAWGVANIIAKIAKPKDMLGFVVWSSAFAPVPLFVASMLLEGTVFGLPPALPSVVGWAAVGFLAYVTTVLAFTWWVGLLNRHSAATVTPFALLIPVFGFGSMALVFGETVTPGVAAGAVIVFIGLAINVFARSGPVSVKPE